MPDSSVHNLPRLRVAIVHDWLVTFAGSERVLAEMLQVFPQADLFAVVDFLSDQDRAHIGKRATTSFIQQLPFARTRYRSYLPLMPLAVEQLDVTGYDLVLSSSHAVSKGVLTGADQIHISYVHSPIRYAWDLQHLYLKEAGLHAGPRSWFARWLLHKMRMWDHRTAAGVDVFLANSQYIARRIRKVYRREAQVLYPPVETAFFCPSTAPRQSHYIAVSRMVPYKRMPLIVQAFAQMGDRELLVVGDGPEMSSVTRAAAKNVRILGHRNRGELRELLQSAQALIFAAEEDFGITPVEAQACGTPVIAYGKGGALETVIPPGRAEPPTGLFFEEQSVASIQEAVLRFESMREVFSPEACARNAARFAPDRFRQGLISQVEGALHFGHSTAGT